MRHTILSLTLLAVAGISNAADQATAVVDQNLLAGTISQTGGSNKPASASGFDASEGPVGGVLAMGHRIDTETELIGATNLLRELGAKPQDWANISTGMQAAMAQDTAARAYVQPLIVVTTGALVAADWQGSYGLMAIDWPHNLPGNLLSFGLGVERFAIEDDVTCAVQGIGRLAPQWRIADSRWTLGPAISIRAGASGHGLALGWDALAHVEYGIAPGLALVLDAGAGQRFDDFEMSDVLPQIGGGLSILF
jgi:hypothetical protein